MHFARVFQFNLLTRLSQSKRLTSCTYISTIYSKLYCPKQLSNHSSIARHQIYFYSSSPASQSSAELPADFEEAKEWKPVYRMTLMPHLQAISKLKFGLTTTLLICVPILGIGFHYDHVSTTLMYSFAGASTLSILSLFAFSYFSTKLVGVISISQTTGLIRIGHLTFWGARKNTLFQMDEIIPPTDFNDSPKSCRTVRVGIVSSGDDKLNNHRSDIKQVFFVTRLGAVIVDSDEFQNLLGFTW